jgi:DNA-binding transcriptional LysR family regulator
MRRPKLDQLEVLVAVIDTGGFSNAAAELGCTQSRISHSINELEASVGTRLLVRSRKGCTPTQAGRRIVATARQILQLAESLVEPTTSGAVVGQVRIACFRSVSTHLLPHALQAISLQYPNLRVDVDDRYEERMEITEAVHSGNATIGVAHLPVAGQLVTRPYIWDRYVLVVPAAFAMHTPFTWEQLRDLPYLQLNCSGAWAILEACKESGFNQKPSRTLSTDSSVVAMVRQEMGFSILPHLAVFPSSDGIQTIALPIEGIRRFSIVSLPHSAQERTVQIVSHFLTDHDLMMRSEAFRAGIVRW